MESGLLQEKLDPYADLSRLQETLLTWFSLNARKLPWRSSYTPYEVWISEVMLQQTQMERGILYFNRWMERFPTLEALGSAREEEVLTLWEGLGYYVRARNILKAARVILRDFAGVFPKDPKILATLPGIGPYTTNAIASIAFEQPLACVDANVERVLSRLFDFDQDLRKDAGKSNFHTLAEHVLVKDRPRSWNQAVMEFGALICTKRPRCCECVLQKFCLAFARNVVEKRPKKPEKSPRKALFLSTGILTVNGSVLIHTQPANGFWAGLATLPFVQEENMLSSEELGLRLKRFLNEDLGLAVHVGRPNYLITHGVTKWKLSVWVHPITLTKEAKITLPPSYTWVAKDALAHLTMPSLFRKIVGAKAALQSHPLPLLCKV